MSQEDVPYRLSLLPETRIAVFWWNGPITVEDRRKNFRIMTTFCQEHQLGSLLIDGRDQVSKTGTVESFDAAKEVPLEMRGLRIAIVHRPDDESLPFMETVAFNRGADTKAFLDFDEAVEWLQSEDS